MRKLFNRFLLLASLAVAAPFAAPAMAFEMGALNSVITTGNDGTWDIRDDDPWLVMDNDTGANAIRYYYLITTKDTIGRRSVSVNIDFRQNSPAARAGLLFGFNEADSSYYFFTVSPSGEFLVSQRTADGFNTIMSATVSEVSDGVNTLTLEERGQSVALSLNGGPGIVSDDPDMLIGGLGIIAIGTGEIAFRDFAMTRTQ